MPLVHVRGAVPAAVLGLLVCGLMAPASADPHVVMKDIQAQVIPGDPGTLISSETLGGAPFGTAAYQVLYRSRGLKGEPIAVSGIVVVPHGAPAAGGRPIVAWAHPTTGLVAKCAPSLMSSRFNTIQGLTEMLQRGYVVTATDYPGLGTSGPHPYLVGESEGRAVLDSVRAARHVWGADAGARFAVWGHSQGGHAALFAGLLAESYAPELSVAGIAAAAPATELAVLLKDDIGTSGGKNLAAMTIWSWNKVFGAPMDRIVQKDAIPAIDKLADECLESLADVIERAGTERPLDKEFLNVGDVTKVEPWRGLMADNTPGPLPSHIPALLIQGEADDTVQPEVTQSYFDRLCSGGGRAKMLRVPGGHDFVARDNSTTAVKWIEDRFAGAPAPSDCAR